MLLGLLPLPEHQADPGSGSHRLGCPDSPSRSGFSSTISHSAPPEPQTHALGRLLAVVRSAQHQPRRWCRRHLDSHAHPHRRNPHHRQLCLMGIPQPKEFFLWLILLSTGVYGFFISIDLFTMFMFYEVAPHPRCIFIGVGAAATRTTSDETHPCSWKDRHSSCSASSASTTTCPAGEPLT